MNDLQNKIKDRIQAANRVLITSHVRPDGDAIGSSLALGLALMDIGKQVQIVLADGIPASFKHLPGADKVTTKADGKFDLIVSVDCSDLGRVGNALDGYHAPDIIIDHHVTTDPFGTLNLIEPDAVATASVLAHYMADWGLTITTPIAANLMTGLITDSLGFRTANTTPEALRQAADLLDLGVDMGSLYYRSLVRRTYVEAKYWGAGLSSLDRKDGIIWVTLTLADRKASGYGGKDDADLVNIISSIDDSEVAIIFVEQNEGNTKVSWRALKPGIDVSQIASQFNGGGHKAAAGAEVNGSLSEIKERVIRVTEESLEQ
jgi:bifunctional oligoribonuclease and PAP phosphatase NrnA